MSNRRIRTAIPQIRAGRNRQALLPTMVLLLFGFVGWYWQTYGPPFEFAMSPRAMSTLGHEMLPASERYLNDRFDMSGAQMGMTPDMLRRLHPSAKLDQDREGNKVMTVPTQRGMLVAWFTEDAELVKLNGQVYANERERIYRLRLDEAFASLTEQDLIKMYSRTYGRPLEATCERNQLGDTPRCTYRWWGGDGIELTAIMKQKIDVNGQNYVLLTTVATNTLKSAKQAAAALRRVGVRSFDRG